MAIKDLPYKNLLVVVAMDSEERALTQGQLCKEIPLGKRLPWKIKKMELPRCSVFIAKSGVGLVNAGLLVSHVSETFDVDAIVQLGVGGALDEKLNTGDVVLAEKVIQHDSVCVTADGRHCSIGTQTVHSLCVCKDRR